MNLINSHPSECDAQLRTLEGSRIGDIMKEVDNQMSGLGIIQTESYPTNHQRIYDEKIAQGFTQVSFKVVKGAYGDVYFTRWSQPGVDRETALAEATLAATKFVDAKIKSSQAQVDKVLGWKVEYIKQYQDECKFINSNDFLKGKVENV